MISARFRSGRFTSMANWMRATSAPRRFIVLVGWFFFLRWVKDESGDVAHVLDLFPKWPNQLNLS